MKTILLLIICLLPLAAAEPTVSASGDTVFLTAKADGTPPLSYQWTRNGKPIPGETNAMITLPNTKETVGTYLCVMSNSAGSVQTDPVQLSSTTQDDEPTIRITRKLPKK